MKYFFISLLTFSLTIQADDKDVLKRMPRDTDFVVKVNIDKMMSIPLLSETLETNEEYKKTRSLLKDKLKIDEEDLQEVFFCAKSSQNLKFDSSKFIPKGALFLRIKKAIDFAAVAKSYPQYLAEGKNGNWDLKEKGMETYQLRALNDNLIIVCDRNDMDDFLAVQAEDSLLKDKETVDLLMKNGFGGVLSLFYTGRISEAPAQFPWLKHFSGGNINLYHDKEAGFDLELTLGFDQLKAVKDASLMLGMGMSFLAMNPDTAKYKDLIKFQSHKNDLILDIKVTNEDVKNMQKSFKAGQVKREERMKIRKQRMKKRKEQEAAKKEQQTEAVNAE